MEGRKKERKGEAYKVDLGGLLNFSYDRRLKKMKGVKNEIHKANQFIYHAFTTHTLEHIKMAAEIDHRMTNSIAKIVTL